MSPSAARLPLLVAVMVTGSLVVSPLPTAAVATVLCWLAVLGSRRAAGVALASGQRPAGHEQVDRWPEMLRAALIGLLLTLMVQGVSGALLQRSWQALLASFVLCAATIPWWLPAVERPLVRTPGERPVTHAGVRSEGARADAQTRRWHSRRWVASVTVAATLGVTSTLALLALFVLFDGLVVGSGSGHAERLTGCQVTGASLAPVVATVSAVFGAMATGATALAARVPPAPHPGAWELTSWSVLGAVLAAGGVVALSSWWLC